MTTSAALSTLMLGPVEAEGAGLEDAAGFFRALAELFGDPSQNEGVCRSTASPNSPGTSQHLPIVAPSSLTATGQPSPMRSSHCAGRPTTRPSCNAPSAASAAMGAWVAVRADHEAAARTCLAVTAQIEPWARPFEAAEPGHGAKGKLSTGGRQRADCQRRRNARCDPGELSSTSGCSAELGRLPTPSSQPLPSPPPARG